jgi:hypothetical protein
VEIKLDDGKWFRANGTTSWWFGWDTRKFSNDKHTLFARAFDGLNYSAEVQLNLTVANINVVCGFIEGSVGDAQPSPGFEFFWFAVVMLIVIKFFASHRNKNFTKRNPDLKLKTLHI